MLLPVETVISRLCAAGCVAADEEADELLAEAPDADTLEVWIRRREEGEPLAWITGTLRFCDRMLRVDPGLYVPRFLSEGLARRAAAILVAGGGGAVDLCTGVGAIAEYYLESVVRRAAGVATALAATAGLLTDDDAN